MLLLLLLLLLLPLLTNQIRAPCQIHSSSVSARRQEQGDDLKEQSLKGKSRGGVGAGGDDVCVAVVASESQSLEENHHHTSHVTRHASHVTRSPTASLSALMYAPSASSWSTTSA